ncbi:MULTISPECIES: RrF2 family transcriptional regulator [unclassified Candidatus Frackibacter]|uniref:RrF2 family transcriptional regulator n=1 Tax=unclassified Candidatus Frackibacter TaxID=2648818 RepID=UPI0008823CEC|nr:MULTISPECIES: Rrf2 family transcriptional regulator [unclassified Candidatus Frackibacter]SDC64820.1 Rrf2 family protein [Candidatus Frackibacter sp. WG11]SEM77205.1 Rrf2 family protein [Candidatus Frackibacter sp. WG12]SFL88891.1 Rrf2 family protein [Candidatus Frackibacter sp. WG13]
MKLSTKGRYGVRAMFDLALHYGEGTTPLRSIAERQNISEHYLEQLIAVLRKSGLVNSVRGAHGGYLLAKEPPEITIGDIIRALEGPIAPSDCVAEDVEKDCENIEECITRLIWKQLQESINEVLDSISLEDLRQEAINAKQKDGHHGYLYHI